MTDVNMIACQRTDSEEVSCPMCGHAFDPEDAIETSPDARADISSCKLVYRCPVCEGNCCADWFGETQEPPKPDRPRGG